MNKEQLKNEVEGLMGRIKRTLETKSKSNPNHHSWQEGFIAGFKLGLSMRSVKKNHEDTGNVVMEELE